MVEEGGGGLMGGRGGGEKVCDIYYGEGVHTALTCMLKKGNCQGEQSLQSRRDSWLS